MSNNIVDFIKKQGNIFDAAKYFGGFDKLRELTKDNDELKSFIKNNSKGWFSFKVSGNYYKFDFHILNYDMEDVENELQEYGADMGDMIDNAFEFTVDPTKNPEKKMTPHVFQ